MKEPGQADEQGPKAPVARTSRLPGKNPSSFLEPLCNLRCFSFATISHIVAAEERGPDLVVAPQSASALAVLVSPKQPLPPSNRKRKRDTGMKNIVKRRGKYAAGVSFDGMTISTRVCDLSTAVEFLMVLTSIKQKFLCAGAKSFEERVREAVVSACDEHEKSELEMGLRFCFCLSARSFIGKCQLTPRAEYPKAGLSQSKHV